MIAVTDALHAWMQGRQWDHFLTLTFGTATSVSTAERQFANGYVRHLERATQCRVDYFGTIERGTTTNRVHVHVVMAGTGGLSVRGLRSAWKRGHADVAIYDPTRNAVRYICKHLDNTADLLIRDLRRTIDSGASGATRESAHVHR